jgi:hypothetical protein
MEDFPVPMNAIWQRNRKQVDDLRDIGELELVVFLQKERISSNSVLGQTPKGCEFPLTQQLKSTTSPTTTMLHSVFSDLFLYSR